MGKVKTSVKSLDSFRAAYDKNVVIPNKIKAAFVGMLKESAEAWAHEAEMLKLAGISTTELGQFRSQFEDHIVEVGGRNAKRVWFADAKVAKKAKG